MTFFLVSQVEQVMFYNVTGSVLLYQVKLYWNLVEIIILVLVKKHCNDDYNILFSS